MDLTSLALVPGPQLNVLSSRSMTIHQMSWQSTKYRSSAYCEWFRQAFEKLKYEVSLFQLQDCAIPKSIVCWIRSFLVGSKPSVRVDSVLSDCDCKFGCSSRLGFSFIPFSLVTGSFQLPDIPAKVVKYAGDFTTCVPIFKNCGIIITMCLRLTKPSWVSR